MSEITPARKLFDLLVTRDFDPEMLDTQGKPAADPAETDIFSFDFRAESGKNYGTIVIMLGDDKDLEVYCADNVGRTMEGTDKDDWFAFLEQLKNFATRNFMSFGIKNLNRLRYSMQGQAAIKEGLFEGYYGTRKISYMGEETDARLVIRHNRTLGEEDKRFRYVESLFIETADQERFKLSFKNLAGGRAMLEHVRQGGRPYDARGNHITEIVSEMAVLSRFNRAQHNRVFEGVTQQLVESAREYYANLQETLKHLGSPRGYQGYFESWAPDHIGEAEALVENLRDLFVEQTLDARIEAALPTLAKIQQGTKMKEAKIFENWVDQISEGTWSLPDTPEAQEKLNELMASELIVGPDATNATEQLYDVIGDDQLFDILNDLADRDPRANIWDDSDVQERLAELGIQTPQSTAAEPADVDQDTAPEMNEDQLDEFKADDFNGDDDDDEEEDDFPEMFEAPFTAVINGKKQNGTVIIYPGEVTSAEWHLKDTIYIKTGMDNVHDTSDFITHAAEYIQEIIKLDGRGHNYVKHLKKRRGVAEGDYPNDPFREIHSQGQQAGIAGKPNNNPYGEPGDSKEASYWDDGYELGLQIRRKRTGVAEGEISMSNPGQLSNQEYKDSLNQRYGQPDLDTSRMNQQTKDFYDKNPSFKQSGKQIVSTGDSRLASKVVPAVTDTKVGRIPMNTPGGSGRAGGSMGGHVGGMKPGQSPWLDNPIQNEDELAEMLRHAGVVTKEGSNQGGVWSASPPKAGQPSIKAPSGDPEGAPSTPKTASPGWGKDYKPLIPDTTKTPAMGINKGGVFQADPKGTIKAPGGDPESVRETRQVNELDAATIQSAAGQRDTQTSSQMSPAAQRRDPMVGLTNRINMNTRLPEDDADPFSDPFFTSKSQSDSAIHAQLKTDLAQGKGTSLKAMNPIDRDQYLKNTGRTWDATTQRSVPAVKTTTTPITTNEADPHWDDNYHPSSFNKPRIGPQQGGIDSQGHVQLPKIFPDVRGSYKGSGRTNDVKFNEPTGKTFMGIPYYTNKTPAKVDVSSTQATPLSGTQSNTPGALRVGTSDNPPVSSSTVVSAKPRITVKPGESMKDAIQRTQTEKEFGDFLKGQSGQQFGAVSSSPADTKSNARPNAPGGVYKSTMPDAGNTIPDAGDFYPESKNMFKAVDESLDSLRDVLRNAGVTVTEGVLTDSTGSTLEHIKDTFKRDVKDFVQSGEMSDALYDVLYDYYFDDMPYGTKKARTGDPYEWISDRFAEDMGLEENLIAPMIEPVAECNYTMEGDYCPEHGLAECGGMSFGLGEELSRLKELATGQISNVNGAETSPVQAPTDIKSTDIGPIIPKVEISGIGNLTHDDSDTPFKVDVRGFGPDPEDLPAGNKLVKPIQPLVREVDEVVNFKPQEGDAMLARIKSLALLR